MRRLEFFAAPGFSPADDFAAPSLSSARRRSRRTMESQLIGFVGVGRMGGPMATRLLDAGHSLVSLRHQRRSGETARRARRGRGGVRRGRGVEGGSRVLSLPTPPIVQAVVTGERGVLQGSVVKTLDRPVDHRAERGHGVCQAAAGEGRGLGGLPVSGGITGATKGTLAVMVSCPKATLRQSRAAAEDVRQDCSTSATSRGWRRSRSWPTTCWRRRRSCCRPRRW